VLIIKALRYLESIPTMTLAITEIADYIEAEKGLSGRADDGKGDGDDYESGRLGKEKMRIIEKAKMILGDAFTDGSSIDEWLTLVERKKDNTILAFHTILTEICESANGKESIKNLVYTIVTFQPDKSFLFLKAMIDKIRYDVTASQSSDSAKVDAAGKKKNGDTSANGKKKGGKRGNGKKKGDKSASGKQKGRVKIDLKELRVYADIITQWIDEFIAPPVAQYLQEITTEENVHPRVTELLAEINGRIRELNGKTKRESAVMKRYRSVEYYCRNSKFDEVEKRTLEILEEHDGAESWPIKVLLLQSYIEQGKWIALADSDHLNDENGAFIVADPVFADAKRVNVNIQDRKIYELFQSLRLRASRHYLEEALRHEIEITEGDDYRQSGLVSVLLMFEQYSRECMGFNEAMALAKGVARSLERRTIEVTEFLNAFKAGHNHDELISLCEGMGIKLVDLQEHFHFFRSAEEHQQNQNHDTSDAIIDQMDDDIRLYVQEHFFGAYMRFIASEYQEKMSVSDADAVHVRSEIHDNIVDFEQLFRDHLTCDEQKELLYVWVQLGLELEDYEYALSIVDNESDISVRKPMLLFILTWALEHNNNDAVRTIIKRSVDYGVALYDYFPVLMDSLITKHNYAEAVSWCIRILNHDAQLQERSVDFIIDCARLIGDTVDAIILYDSYREPFLMKFSEDMRATLQKERPNNGNYKAYILEHEAALLASIAPYYDAMRFPTFNIKEFFKGLFPAPVQEHTESHPIYKSA